MKGLHSNQNAATKFEQQQTSTKRTP